MLAILLLLSIPLSLLRVLPNSQEMESSHPRENSFPFISLYIWHVTDHACPGKSVYYSVLCQSHFEIHGKTFEFFWNCSKGYHKPVNQDWQDIGRVFRDRSLPFATSTPLSWASLTTSSVSWCLHMDLLSETQHPMSQPRVLPIPSIKPQRPGLHQKLPYSFSSGGPVLCGGDRIF